MLKKIMRGIAFVLCVALLSSFTLAFAAPVKANNGSEHDDCCDYADIDHGEPTRAEVCPNCPLGRLVVSKVYGTWDDYGTQQCPKFGNRLDILQKRIVYITQRCGSCGWIVTFPEWEYRVVCIH